MARRSLDWFNDPGIYGWLRTAALKGMGFTADDRPIIGICNTWSELTHCNAHLRHIADAVRRGVTQAGGLALEFPVLSTGEFNMRPTAMLFRNLASMDVEEAIRANPLDAVVLLGGCDKTVPALLMGAARRRCTRNPGHRRPATQCSLARRDRWIVHRLPSLSNGIARANHRGRMGRLPEKHHPQCRPLHDDGHGFDHGLPDRNAWVSPRRATARHPRRTPDGCKSPNRRDDSRSNSLTAMSVLRTF